MRRRLRSQGLVEYALATATLALIGVAGLNALSLAERQYFVGVESALVSPTPGVPGGLLHPTSIDTPACFLGTVPKTEFEIGQTMTCRTTVRDTFYDPTDLKRPWGEIQWFLDGAFIGDCDMLPDSSPGFSNSCPLAWPVVAPTGVRSLVARYCPVDSAACETPDAGVQASNHVESPASGALSITVLKVVTYLNDVCENHVPTVALPDNQAEIGHPLLCSVKVKEGNTDLSGVNVTWSTESAVSGSPSGPRGIGIFTCSVGAGPAFMATDINSCPSPMLITDPPHACGSGGQCVERRATCKTNSQGICYVVYRRIYDSNGKGQGAHTLTISVHGYDNTHARPVTIVEADPAPPKNLHPHDSETLASCKAADPGHTFIQLDQRTHSVNSVAHFPYTFGVAVNGPADAELKCDLVVYDKDMNPAFANPPGTGDPNVMDGHPPYGKVDVFLEGVSAPIKSCEVQRVDMSAGHNQKSGQAPFLSECSVTFTVPRTGPNPRQVEFRYVNTQPIDGHISSFDYFDVVFNP